MPEISTLVDSYGAAWNETNPERRRALMTLDKFGSHPPGHVRSERHD
jgi:hypothetical protein